jgi:hypothetical protein
MTAERLVWTRTRTTSVSRCSASVASGRMRTCSLSASRTSPWMGEKLPPPLGRGSRLPVSALSFSQ